MAHSLLDGLSVIPVSDLESATGWDFSGVENALETISGITGATYAGEAFKPVVDSFHSAEDSSEAMDMLGFLGQYFTQLFETEANAAKMQAESNEAAAVNAWKRSEQAADAALARARKFRQTSALDNVQALKAAGLNPVLAAGGGFSGSSVTAPQANAPASTSSKADGLNAADLLMAIAALLNGAGSLIGSISPKRIISEVTRWSGK